MIVVCYEFNTFCKFKMADNLSKMADIRLSICLDTVIEV